MTEFVVKNEWLIRLAFFGGIFLIIGFVELLVPRKALTTSKQSRWFANIGIVFINTFLLSALIRKYGHVLFDCYAANCFVCKSA